MGVGGVLQVRGVLRGGGGKVGNPTVGSGRDGGVYREPHTGGGHEGLCGEASTTDNERKANVGGWGGGGTWGWHRVPQNEEGDKDGP